MTHLWLVASVSSPRLGSLPRHMPLQLPPSCGLGHTHHGELQFFYIITVLLSMRPVSGGPHPAEWLQCLSSARKGTIPMP